jgi:hypothetical protein
MRLLTIISFLLIWKISFSQENEILKVAFKDKSNFHLTTLLDNKKPAVYYVLNKTDKWNTHRFHLDEDLKSETVVKQLARDEHSPYNHSYIFKDPQLDSLFSDSEKQHLYQLSQSIKPRQLADTFKVFRLINSFNTAENGFFFSVTDPIFTTDKQYAFLDITSFKKGKDTEDS